jgi:hypothetical protein
MAQHQMRPVRLALIMTSSHNRLERGWDGPGRTNLHDLGDEFKGRLEVETLDICEQAQVTALREHLSGRVFEMLVVNAVGRTVPL